MKELNNDYYLMEKQELKTLWRGPELSALTELDLLSAYTLKLSTRTDQLELSDVLDRMEELIESATEEELHTVSFNKLYLVSKAYLLCSMQEGSEAFELLNSVNIKDLEINPIARVCLYNRMGLTYLEMSAIGKAIDCFASLLEQAEPRNDGSVEFERHYLQFYLAAMINLGGCYQSIGEMHNARKKYEEALDLLQSYDLLETEKFIEHQAPIYCSLADLHIDDNKTEEAAVYVKRMEALATLPGKEAYLPMYYSTLSSLELARKNYNDAESAIKNALELNTGVSFRHKIYFLFDLVLTLSNLNREEEALQYLHEIIDLTRDTELHKDRKNAFLELSRIKASQGEFETAYTSLLSAFHNLESSLKGTENESLRKLEVRQAEIIKEKEVEIERLKNVELKNALDALHAAQDDLVKSERMAAIGNIASEIAHEVQNPLNFINNFSDVNNELIEEIEGMLDDSLNPEELKEVLSMLKSNSAIINGHGVRVAEVVGQLRDDSRMGRKN